jgi:hypothetical protein
MTAGVYRSERVAIPIDVGSGLSPNSSKPEKVTACYSAEHREGFLKYQAVETSGGFFG